MGGVSIIQNFNGQYILSMIQTSGNESDMEGNTIIKLLDSDGVLINSIIIENKLTFFDKSLLQLDDENFIITGFYKTLNNDVNIFLRK